MRAPTVVAIAEWVDGRARLDVVRYRLIKDTSHDNKTRYSIERLEKDLLGADRWTGAGVDLDLLFELVDQQTKTIAHLKLELTHERNLQVQ